MDGQTLARIGAIVLVAVAIVANAIEINRKDERQDSFATQGRPAAARNPLDAELLRCSQIGEAGAHDPGCLKAWAESRRRFLGRGTAPSELPATVAPTAQDSAITKEDISAGQAAPMPPIEPTRPEVR